MRVPVFPSKLRMARFALLAWHRFAQRRRTNPRLTAAAIMVGALLGSGIAAYGPASAIVSHPPAAEPSGYRVEPGDTLWDIAARHGISLDALAEANGLPRTERVWAGQRLTIPAGGGQGESGGGSTGGTHTVVTGETVWDIAARYGVSSNSLVTANGLANPDIIWPGTTLAIPGGGGPAAVGADSGSGSGRGGGSTASASPAGSGRDYLAGRMDYWAAHYGIPADLLKGVTWLESGWQEGIVSPHGAIGIGQLLPETADFMQQRIGVSLSPWVADDNIRMSAGYLRMLLDSTGWSENDALAAYYQGLGALREHGPYGESVHYAEMVQSLRRRF